MLFEYPKQAFVGRSIPKNKIYEHARITKRLKQKFVNEVAGIRWAYKLATESLNLRSTALVPEIEVFVVELKSGEVSAEVIRTIDNAIPFPIVYELVSGDRLKVMAAYKRPSDGDRNKWVTDIYFESKWQKVNAKRKPLPVALDLAKLYEQMLATLLPGSIREGEVLRETTARIAQLRGLERTALQLESKLKKEKQFNRKVELNRSLREIKTAIADLE